MMNQENLNKSFAKADSAFEKNVGYVAGRPGEHVLVPRAVGEYG